MRFNYDIASDTLDDHAQNALNFNDTDSVYTLTRVFSYLMLKKTSDKLEATDKNGVEIIDKSFDKATKKAMITFKRPLDVSYDISFFLQPDLEYKIYLVWGVFTDDND